MFGPPLSHPPDVERPHGARRHTDYLAIPIPGAAGCGYWPGPGWHVTCDTSEARPAGRSGRSRRCMWLNWLPWRYLVSRLARAKGFIDPITVLARLHRFAQPSEVTEPIELLRAGVLFHARGLINSRTIQHNLDWVWPFWIERQFNPRDVAFVPRAFSITHVNLTHRNWTAVGLPDCDRLPVVDPRGLVTPLFDGWSLDAWVLPERGPRLLPSRAERVQQRLTFDADTLAGETQARQEGCDLAGVADVIWQGDQPWCRLHVRAQAASGGWLALAVRPVNPEGVSFVHDLELSPDRTMLWVNDDARVELDRPPDRVCLSE